MWCDFPGPLMHVNDFDIIFTVSKVPLLVFNRQVNNICKKYETYLKSIPENKCPYSLF